MTAAGKQEDFIAVVDDNPTDLTIAGFLIEKEGFSYKLFDNFMKLIPFLKEQKEHVRLILMDIDMPGATGIDILKRLKREPTLSGIPVMMMTGDSTVQTVQRAISFGAADYIVKPLDPMIFEEKIEKLLKHGTQTQNQKWIEYKLGQIREAKVNLNIPGTIVSLGELSLTIASEYPVRPGAVYVLETDIFQSIGVNAVPLRVESCIEPHEGMKFYSLQCSIIGLSGNDLKKVRLFCQTLMRENARSV